MNGIKIKPIETMTSQELNQALLNHRKHMTLLINRSDVKMYRWLVDVIACMEMRVKMLEVSEVTFISLTAEEQQQYDSLNWENK